MGSEIESDNTDVVFKMSVPTPMNSASRLRKSEPRNEDISFEDLSMQHDEHGIGNRFGKKVFAQRKITVSENEVRAGPRSFSELEHPLPMSILSPSSISSSCRFSCSATQLDALGTSGSYRASNSPEKIARLHTD